MKEFGLIFASCWRKPQERKNDRAPGTHVQPRATACLKPLIRNTQPTLETGWLTFSTRVVFKFNKIKKKFIGKPLLPPTAPQRIPCILKVRRSNGALSVRAHSSLCCLSRLFAVITWPFPVCLKSGSCKCQRGISVAVILKYRYLSIYLYLYISISQNALMIGSLQSHLILNHWLVATIFVELSRSLLYKDSSCECTDI